MKPIRCIFGQHKYGDWIVKGKHVESTCRLCGHTRAQYPPTEVMLAELLTDSLFNAIKLINGIYLKNEERSKGGDNK